MKKRLIALLLCLVMLLTCMGAALDAVVEPADTAADGTEQTDITDPAEPTGEDTTEPDPTAEPTESTAPVEETDPPAEPTEQQPEEDEEAPEEEAPVADDDAVVDGEETDAEPVDEEEDADTDEDIDAEPVYPLVSFTNVAPFLEPVTGSGSTTFLDKAKDFFIGIVDAIKGGSATPADNTEDTSGGTGSGETKGLNVSKTATYDANTGKYTITLEAYATGEKTTTVVTKSTPTDIILVLDLSSSMEEKDMETANYDQLDEKTNDDLYRLYKSSKLYYLDNKNYYPVEVNYSSSGNKKDKTYTYTYTYTVNGETKTVTYSGKDTKPELEEGVTFYQRNVTSTQTRLEALQAACTEFANSVADKCTSDDGTTVDHRIAVVGFNGYAYLYDGATAYFTKDETFDQSGYKNLQENKPTEGTYKSAFKDMSTAAGKDSVNASIDALSTNTYTYTNKGLAMANTIFSYNFPEKDETRNRVVVLFTDGYPSNQGSTTFVSSIANKAVNWATTLKNEGATVYSVAFLEGADPKKAGNMNSSNGVDQVNWFLQTVSSNNGTPKNPGYYLTASDSDSLSKIFKNISEEIKGGSVSTTLDERSVVKDVVSQCFTMPDDANSITVKTYACTGKNDNGLIFSDEETDLNVKDAVTIDATARTVNVTGFNFSENWCGTETKDGTTIYRGNKLEISFDVEPNKDFLGGNDVYTNSSAGVYENAKATEPTVEFNKPQVNVPIKDVTVTAADKNVYLLGSVTGDQLKNDAVVKVGSVSLDLSKADRNYGLDSWQTQYVNIEVKITDKDGNVVTDTTFQNLTDDAEYTVSVTVSPKTKTPTSKEGETATTKSNSATANINVFKPVLTFKDSEAYYGDNAPTDFSSNLVNTEWKHGNTSADTNKMGTAPTLTPSYAPDVNKIADGKINTKTDIGVGVTVKIGDKDVTNYTTFVHNNCADQTCTLPDGTKFLIHVRTCTLTIKKAGGAKDESYVFYVYKDGVKYTEVAIWSNGTATICELPVGTYTIAEDTGWSWRYGRSGTSNPSYDPASVTLSADNTDGTITCTNRNPFAYWLNGFSEIFRNIIKAVTT